MNRPAKYLGLVLVAIITLFTLAACGGDTPAPANTQAPTNTARGGDDANPTRTPRATRTPRGGGAEPTNTRAARATNTRTARATSTPEREADGDWETYVAEEGNWSIDYPSDWTVNEDLAPNVQFFAPTNDAFVQVTYADVGAELDPEQLVEIASTQLGNSFPGYEETGREEQPDGSTRLDFTFEQDGTAFDGSAFIEQRGTGLYILMFISEPDATDTYGETFSRILESYSPPSDDDAGDEPTPEGDDSGDTGTGELLAVGDTGESDGLEITVNSFRRTSSGLLSPDAGNEYLIINMTAVNTTDEEKVVSSLLNFSVKDDGGNGTDFNQSFTAGVETSFDGTIPAGDELTGEIAYEIPEDATDLVLHFDPILGGDELRWALEE
ncbi:MAG: DUF4352 domain-containing protein [Chloroflexota bacterium]|nr:DUF4352 domain-containing protein [Chloroflexota bacterium]MDQ5867307.1 DUF4352 domain-containing protein [Chloroflexota bacterium]